MSVKGKTILILAILAFLIVPVLAAPEICAGTCYDVDNQGIFDDNNMPYITNAYNSTTGININETVGIVTQSDSSAYCIYHLGAGHTDASFQTIQIYSTNFTHLAPPMFSQTNGQLSLNNNGYGSNPLGAFNYVGSASTAGKSTSAMAVGCFGNSNTMFGHVVTYHILATSPIYVSDTVSAIEANFTVTVISNTTGETIPRATVDFHSQPSAYNRQTTDLNGETTFPPTFVTGMGDGPMYFNVSKAGYNDTSLVFYPSYTDVDQAFTIYMGDLISGGGGVAQVFVDIADLDDPTTGISGAAVGIENTTATVNQWYYITATTPTAQFNTTYGGINLSVGQPVVFSAYKEGIYTANNSGTYVIPHPVSHTTLYLKKVSGNATATYQWPVSIVDATTGYTIADSYLNSSLTSGSIWYNRSSPTGKFNVTGTGATGTYPISLGDQLTLVGTKGGYQYNWFSLIMTTTNNGVTQYINLMPSSALPLTTEFAALVSVYEAGTTKALAGARVAITPGIQNTTTNSVGAAAFQNLTALKTYTATVSKSGFSTTTKTFTGMNQSITTVDVSLSPSSVNPTATITPTGGPTAVPTVVPTTLPGGNYGGFFGPWYTALHKMGAYDEDLTMLLAAIIIIILAFFGGVASGWSPVGFNTGAALGLILCAGFHLVYYWLILAGIAWMLLPLVLRRLSW